MYFLFGFIPDTDVLQCMKFDEGRQRGGRWIDCQRSEHTACGKIELFPQVQLYMRRGCGQAFSFLLTSLWQMRKQWPYVDVTIFFSCSDTGTASVPEFTFTRRYCQELYCSFPTGKELASNSSVLRICIASFFTFVSKLSAEKRVFGSMFTELFLWPFPFCELVCSCVLFLFLFFSCIQH